MSPFGLIIAAIVVIATLAALRTRLIYELMGVSLLLFGNRNPGLVVYAILMLPGTILHELSHWLVAEILQVKTGAIQILPAEVDGGGEQRLGSVQTVSTDPLRGSLIGLAPLLSGTAVLLLLSLLLSRFWGVAPWWQIILLVYALMVVGNSMLTSSADRKQWPFLALILVFAYLLATRLGLTLTLAAQNTLTQALTSLLQTLGLTALINLVTIGICYGIRKGAERITNKKIVRR